MRIADEPVFENIGADFALQIDDEFVIGANFEADLDDAQYFNHSCNPNAGLRGQLNLVAMRDIAPDEEVTFDYAMVLYCGKGAKPYQLECACGAPSCRRIVTDDDWQRRSCRRATTGISRGSCRTRSAHASKSRRRRAATPMVDDTAWH